MRQEDDQIIWFLNPRGGAWQLFLTKAATKQRKSAELFYISWIIYKWNHSSNYHRKDRETRLQHLHI